MGTIMYKGESYGGGGGTNVVANPSGTATGALNKLQVGNDIYSVGGGSGSGITTYEKTITTTQYGWWWVEDENGNILDPSQHTLLAITPIVDYNTMGDVYYGAFFFEYDNNQFAPTIQKGYLSEIGDLNNGGYIRQSMTIKVRVSYI